MIRRRKDYQLRGVELAQEHRLRSMLPTFICQNYKYLILKKLILFLQDWNYSFNYIEILVSIHEDKLQLYVYIKIFRNIKLQ